MTKWRFSHDTGARLFPAGALQESTGLSITGLSKIIRDLEDRGMVEVSKERKNRYGHALVRLSDDSGTRFKQLLKNLNRTINH